MQLDNASNLYRKSGVPGTIEDGRRPTSASADGNPTTGRRRLFTAQRKLLGFSCERACAQRRVDCENQVLFHCCSNVCYMYFA